MAWLKPKYERYRDLDESLFKRRCTTTPGELSFSKTSEPIPSLARDPRVTLGWHPGGSFSNGAFYYRSRALNGSD